MVKEIPEKLIRFDPPDYELDGSGVLEIIKDMPEKINLPISIKPSAMEEMYVGIRAKKNPQREVPQINKEVVEVLYFAVQEMLKIFENLEKPKKKRPTIKSLQKKSMERKYSISDYVVLLSIHTEYDIVNVSFCPKINPKDWMCPLNDLGMEFYFSLSNHTLLRIIGMR